MAVRWLTAYQRGSIFGAAIVFVAMAAAISTVPHAIDNPPAEKRYAATEDANRSHHEEETWRQWATTDPVAAFTLCVALIAAAQAGLFVWQLIYMRRGIDDAGIAANAARDAAKAAADSNRISRELFVAEQRPWLSIEIIPLGDLVVSPAGAVKIALTVTYTNYGRSPAINSLIGQIDIISDETNIIGRQNAIIVDIDQFVSMGKNDGIVIFPTEKFETELTATGNVPAGSFHTKLYPSSRTPSQLIIVGCCKYTFPGGGDGLTRFSYVIGVIVRGVQGQSVTYYLKHNGPHIAVQNLHLGRGNIGNSAV